MMRGWRKGTIGVAAFLMLGAPAARAQTRFARADTAPDLARYTTSEECIAGAVRTMRSAELAQPVWRDTLAPNVSENLEPLAPAVVTFARRCSAKFKPDSVALSAYGDWITLYLMAGRDADADIVERRRLANTRWDSLDTFGSRQTILKELLLRYTRARPMRWKKVLAIGAMFEEAGTAVSPFEAMDVYSVQFGQAESVRDTVIRRVMAEKIVASAKTFTPVMQTGRYYQQTGRYVVQGALDYLSHVALLDSLHRSAPAYVALKRANWDKARGASTGKLPLFVGEQAKPLVADFWFGADAKAPPRPTTGKVSLIVFLRGGCREEAPIFGQLARPTFPGSCWDTYASVKRLAQQFPALELTIASQTTGYVGDMPPMPPEEEARILRSWWHGFHQLPAALAVAHTKFFRLAPPDNRRIDEPVPNNVNYTFGQNKEAMPEYAYLVDMNGMVLHYGQLGRWGEREFRELLEIVTARGR